MRGLSLDESHVVLPAYCVAVESLGSETLCHLEVSSDEPELRNAKALTTRMAARWQGDHTELLNTKITVAIPYKQILAELFQQGKAVAYMKGI